MVQCPPMKVSTIYQKSLRQPGTAQMLKPGSNNKKLGFKITSKRWEGKRLYSLTLEERKTCPTTCHHWNDCYGDNMPFAHRFTTAGLIPKLKEEIDSLMNKHPDGIVVRLHVLGDFYSEDYVRFWEEMLFVHPKLCLFGYTSRKGDNIAHAIWLLNIRFDQRCVIRCSDNKEAGKPHGNSQEPFVQDWKYAAEESFEGNSFDCPEQTGKVKSCAACGLCWTTKKTVRFLSH